MASNEKLWHSYSLTEGATEMRQWSRHFRMDSLCRSASFTPSTTQPHSCERLDVYRDCERPPIRGKELGFLTDGGRIFEQGDIEAGFVKRAKEMGGDALLLFPPVKSVESPAGWTLYDTFLYEAVVIAYD